MWVDLDRERVKHFGTYSYHAFSTQILIMSVCVLRYIFSKKVTLDTY